MAYNIYVKNKQGDRIVSFGESVRSRLMVSELWRMADEDKIKREPSECYLQEVYALENHIAIPFLIKHIEEELESLKRHLKEPPGKFDWQKKIFRHYEKNIDTWKALTDEILIFEVWDMS